MTIHKLTLKLDAPVIVRRDHRAIDRLRAAIIKTAERSSSIDEDDMRLLNFRPPPPYHIPPTILYGQPVVGKKAAFVYGYGETGEALLEKLAACVEGNTLRVGDTSVKVQTSTIRRDIPFLPSTAPDRQRYYTATPLVLYDKPRDHAEWYALTMEYKERDQRRYEAEFHRSITNLIRANIEYQMKMRVKNREYPFVKEIDIDIERFHFVIGKYHKDRKPVPLLYLDFSSSWHLPIFLGHHTGKGYGAIVKSARPRSTGGAR